MFFMVEKLLFKRTYKICTIIKNKILYIKLYYKIFDIQNMRLKIFSIIKSFL